MSALTSTELEAPNGVSLGPRPESYFIKVEDPLVFGFWKVPNDICAQVCYDAILAGYRRLDCACDYGNEREVGQGIARALKDGIIRDRSELFITSKLWNTYHTQPEHVEKACQTSLRHLQLEYLDEYLIHFPIALQYVPFEAKYPPGWTNLDGNMVAVTNDILGITWKAMEALVDKGWCRTIGVCNFTTQLLRQLIATCRIRPATLQIELHPHLTQDRMLRFSEQVGLRVTAFSIFGSASYVQLNMATEQDSLWNEPIIQEISNKYTKTPAQVMIRWAMQRNTLPLCKTSQPDRMIENRNVFDFSLSEQEMMKISSLNRNRRYNDPGHFCEGMGTFYPIYE